MEPRRVMIGWEYLCDGIEWVSTKEEQEAPYHELEKVQRPGKPPIPRPWPERLSEQLIRDLKAWNDSWGLYGHEDREVVWELQGRGRELAVRVQEELGTDEWEVLYNLGGRVHRVHPAGQLARRNMGTGASWLRAAGPAGVSGSRELAEEEAGSANGSGKTSRRPAKTAQRHPSPDRRAVDVPDDRRLHRETSSHRGFSSAVQRYTSTRDIRGMTVCLPDQQVINSAAQHRRRRHGTSDLENR